MDTLAFIARYEAVLKAKGLLKMKLYQECGISDAAVSQWRKGKTVPSTRSIQKIADFLNVSYEYLVTGSEQQKAPTPEGERPITLDDFTYAMQNEAKELTEMDKQILLSMAKQLNDARTKQNGESG